MDQPRLRLESSAAWGRERSPAVVIAKETQAGAAVEILLGYEPEDDGARHRSAWQDAIPWPAGRPMPGGESEAAHLAALAFRPALLLLAEAATPWQKACSIRGDEWSDRMPRLYLGGRLPDGRIGALPLFVEPAIEEPLSQLGTSVCPADVETPGSLELRITRDATGVRYRFGHCASRTSGARRWDGGDVRLPSEAALAPGEGPLIPALPALLAEREALPAGPRAVVLLEVGEGVRFVDVLRAVECAGGSPEVVFFETSLLFMKEIEFMRLPAPQEAGDSARLVEDFGKSGRVILNVALTEDGAGIVVKAKGRTLAPTDLPAALAGRETALVRAHGVAPWGDVLDVVRAVRGAGLALQFAFVEEEDGFEPGRLLAVPPPLEGAAVTEVTVRTAEDGAWTLAPDPGDPRGRSFHLVAPAATPTAAVLQAVLHLLARGAAGIEL
jgi:hypothetical protein